MALEGNQGAMLVGAFVLFLVVVFALNGMNRAPVNVVCADVDAKMYGMRPPENPEEPELGEEVPMRMSKEGMKDNSNDPFFNVDKYRPKAEYGDDQPDWVKTFTSDNDKLLQQNFIDTTTPEHFQVTRSVCGRRFMSRDIRRTPTVTRDPTTVNNFQLPVIDPACALSYNALHPGLDPNPC